MNKTLACFETKSKVALAARIMLLKVRYTGAGHRQVSAVRIKQTSNRHSKWRWRRRSFTYRFRIYSAARETLIRYNDRSVQMNRDSAFHARVIHVVLGTVVYSIEQPLYYVNLSSRLHVRLHLLVQSRWFRSTSACSTGACVEPDKVSCLDFSMPPSCTPYSNSQQWQIHNSPEQTLPDRPNWIPTKTCSYLSRICT